MVTTSHTAARLLVAAVILAGCGKTAQVKRPATDKAGPPVLAPAFVNRAAARPMPPLYSTELRGLNDAGIRGGLGSQVPDPAQPPTAPAPAAPASAKERLSEAFRRCMEAQPAHAARCAVQKDADAARMAALAELRTAPAGANDIRARYLKTVADEDRAITDVERALDDWAAAIERLRAAAADYARTGSAADAEVAAAMRAATTHENEYRRNAGEFERTRLNWEKQRGTEP